MERASNFLDLCLVLLCAMLYAYRRQALCVLFKKGGVS
jgi:hypothetical protein